MQLECRQCTAQSFESSTGQNDRLSHHHGIALSKIQIIDTNTKQNTSMSPNTNTVGHNDHPAIIVALLSGRALKIYNTTDTYTENEDKHK